MLLTHPVFRPEELRGSRGTNALFDGLIWTYNGRGALYQLFRAQYLRSQRADVLLPAFHCPTVVDPALAAGCTPNFYAIDDNLEFDLAALLERLSPRVSAVVVIHYFGRSRDLALLRGECDRHGVLLIEDCCHSFLRAQPVSLAGHQGHAAVFSPWKLIPCVVSGAIRLNSQELMLSPPGALPRRDELRIGKRLASEALSHSRAASAALARKILRRPLIEQLTRRADEPDLVPPKPEPIVYDFELPQAAARVSTFARRILRRHDLEFVSRTRRRNYERLLGQLNRDSILQPVLGTLPADACPWALPLRVPERARIDYRLRHAGVPQFTFGETLHTALLECRAREPALVASAESLARSVLCLPVHQQITDPEIDWMAERVNAIAARY